jgi:hypothetical protein
MPEEGKACHDPHYVNKDDGRKGDVACAPSVVGIKAEEEIHDAELIKKVEELIEEPRFAKAIDLRDVFAISEFFGYTGLVPVGDAPGEAFGNSLRCPFD